MSVYNGAILTLSFRVQLDPSEVLEHIQASAEEELYRFTHQVPPRILKSQSTYLRYFKKEEGASPLCWREARYQEILDRKAARKPDKFGGDRGNSFGGVLASLRKMFPGSGNNPASSAIKEDSSISMVEEPSSAHNKGQVDDSKDSELGLSTIGELKPFDMPVCGLARDAWAWIMQHDELTQAMKEGGALFGFVEAPITFPPSFR